MVGFPASHSLVFRDVLLKPIGSMYGIFTYICLIFMVHVGKYTSPMDPMGNELNKNPPLTFMDTLKPIYPGVDSWTCNPRRGAPCMKAVRTLQKLLLIYYCYIYI